MKTNKKKVSENYLLRVPMPAAKLRWKPEEDGKIMLMIENKGAMNRLAQKLFHKPEISYIHLDDLGSFVWTWIDGKKNIIELGELVKEEFGEAAEPVYPRLAKYFQILDSYHFITWKE